MTLRKDQQLKKYNDEWMKEINDLNEKDFEKYENDLIKELMTREDIISS